VTTRERKRSMLKRISFRGTFDRRRESKREKDSLEYHLLPLSDYMTVHPPVNSHDKIRTRDYSHFQFCAFTTRFLARESLTEDFSCSCYLSLSPFLTMPVSRNKAMPLLPMLRLNVPSSRMNKRRPGIADHSSSFSLSFTHDSIFVVFLVVWSLYLLDDGQYSILQCN
jgi:hypothetical protein